MLVLLLALPILRIGNFEQEFVVSIPLMLPPLHLEEESAPPFDEYDSPESSRALQIVISPQYYYTNQLDYEIRCDSHLPRFNRIGNYSSFDKLSHFELIHFLKEHQKNCPKYLIELVILPDARFGQMIEMLLLMHKFRVQRFRLARVSDLGICE